MSDAPLTSPSPDSLSALFTSDPTTLSDADLMALIHELRRRRSEFASAEAAKALKPKSARAKADPASAPTAAEMDKPPAEFSLDDLL